MIGFMNSHDIKSQHQEQNHAEPVVCSVLQQVAGGNWSTILSGYDNPRDAQDAVDRLARIGVRNLRIHVRSIDNAVKYL